MRVYYRCLFLRAYPLSDWLSSVFARWEQRWRRADAPADQTTWEIDYREGRWTYLNNIEQAVRYMAVIGYITHAKSHGAILDVGCGEGVLLRYCHPDSYSRYVGLDLAETAIGAARQVPGHLNASFVCADAESYTPAGTFDVIVFNECLYYFADALSVLDRYVPLMSPGGVFVVSSFLPSPRARATLRAVRSRYRTVVESTVKTGQKSWSVAVFAADAAPRERSS